MFKRISIVMLVSLAVFTGCSSEVEKESPKAEVTEGKVQAMEIPEGSQDYRVNTEKSTFEWEASKVTLTHTGNVGISKGQVFVKGGEIINGNVKMDMSTINVTDLEEGPMRDKLMMHLRSADFFDVEKNPSSSFQIVSVTKNEEGAEGTHTVKGNLTIKGITKMISFPADIQIDGSEVKAQAEFEVDRTEWDIRYGSGKFFESLGDNLIDDNFKVKLNLVAEKA